MLSGVVNEVVYHGTSTNYTVTTAAGPEFLIFDQNASSAEDLAERGDEECGSCIAFLRGQARLAPPGPVPPLRPLVEAQGVEAPGLVALGAGEAQGAERDRDLDRRVVDLRLEHVFHPKARAFGDPALLKWIFLAAAAIAAIGFIFSSAFSRRASETSIPPYFLRQV